MPVESRTYRMVNLTKATIKFNQKHKHLLRMKLLSSTHCYCVIFLIFRKEEHTRTHSPQLIIIPF